MFKITIPTNKRYTGIVAGVAFVNGEGQTDDIWKSNWFLENRYSVEDITEKTADGENPGTEDNQETEDNPEIEEGQGKKKK